MCIRDRVVIVVSLQGADEPPPATEGAGEAIAPAATGEPSETTDDAEAPAAEPTASASASTSVSASATASAPPAPPRVFVPRPKRPEREIRTDL